MMSNDGDEYAEMRPFRSEAIRDALLSALRDEPMERARRKRRLYGVWGGLSALVVMLGVTAGAVILDATRISNTELVHCLSSATRNPDGSYPGSQATISTGTGEGRVEDALELCSQMWEQGVLNDGFDPDRPTNSPGTAPPALQVCVMPDGSAAVVPGPTSAVCSMIGLAPLDG